MCAWMCVRRCVCVNVCAWMVCTLCTRAVMCIVIYHAAASMQQRVLLWNTSPCIPAYPVQHTGRRELKVHRTRDQQRGYARRHGDVFHCAPFGCVLAAASVQPKGAQYNTSPCLPAYPLCLSSLSVFTRDCAAANAHNRGGHSGTHLNAFLHTLLVCPHCLSSLLTVQLQVYNRGGHSKTGRNQRDDPANIGVLCHPCKKVNFCIKMH